MLQSSQPNPSLYESQSGDSTPTISTMTHHASSAIDPIQFFSVVDAYTQPKYTYNATTKTFQLGAKPSIIDAPKEKASLFRERYHIILQRLLRNDLFMSYPMHAPQNHQTAGKISSIKTLLGRRNQHFLLFGLLTRSPSGALTLSDPDASITLDLTDAVSAGGSLRREYSSLSTGNMSTRIYFEHIPLSSHHLNDGKSQNKFSDTLTSWEQGKQA